MNPSVLIALCARDRVFESICQAFYEALYKCSTWSGAYVDDSVGSRFDKARQDILQAFRQIEDEEQSSFMRDYRSGVLSRESWLLSSLARSSNIENELFSLLEQTEPIVAKTDALAFQDDDYGVVAAHALGLFRLDKFLLAPLAFWLTTPIQPIESISSCVDAILAITKPGPCSIKELVQGLWKSGVEVTEELIGAIALCDPRLLLVWENHWVVELAPGRLRRLDLLAQNIRRETYLDIKTLYARTDSDDFETQLPVCPSFDAAYVANLIGTDDGLVGTTRSESFGLKLLQRSLMGELRSQGMSTSLHAEIVRQLVETRRAMSHGELEKSIGFSVPLSPETLPPGRIMAYAPSDRFLRAEKAFYVLREWVETDTEKRGRILRARVVTPFVDKNISFSDEIFLEEMRNDPLYARFGVAVASQLAQQLAKRLPDRPTELYFINVIQMQIEAKLSKTHSYVGRSAFVRLRTSESRADGEHIDSWRRRAIAAVLECRVDELPDALGRLEAHIAARLREVVSS